MATSGCFYFMAHDFVESGGQFVGLGLYIEGGLRIFSCLSTFHEQSQKTLIMQVLARPNVWMFVMLAFGISWAAGLVPGWVGLEGLAGSILQAFTYSLGPFLAAIVMRKWVFQSSTAGMGWNRKYYDYRWIALTVFAPLAILAITLGIVYVMGNLLHTPGFGRIEILGNTLGSFLQLMPDWMSGGLKVNLALALSQQDFWGTFLTLLGLILVIGSTIGLLMHLGGEMGFRGYLLRELQPLGFLGGNTVLGLLVGAWQSMLVIQILPGWSWAYLPLFLSIMGFHLSMAFPLAWLSLKTRSVYASATFSSVLAQVGGLSTLFFWNSNPYLAGVNGLSGILVLMAATFAIIWFDRRFVSEYEKLVY